MCRYCKASDDTWSTFPAPPVVVPDGPSEHSAPDGSRLMNPIDMTLQIPPGMSSEHRNSIGNDSSFNESTIEWYAWCSAGPNFLKSYALG